MLTKGIEFDITPVNCIFLRVLKDFSIKSVTFISRRILIWVCLYGMEPSQCRLTARRHIVKQSCYPWFHFLFLIQTGDEGECGSHFVKQFMWSTYTFYTASIKQSHFVCTPQTLIPRDDISLRCDVKLLNLFTDHILKILCFLYIILSIRISMIKFKYIL